MNRLAGLLCVVLLALSLSVGNVEANGQVILDRIEPIKDDKITFLDPLKTDQGAIENIDTGSIDVTRQHELRVEVPNVSLTGLEGGVSIGGSLGVLLSSAYRDIAFEAANGHVQLTANQFHFTASENVVVESQAGDVTINSSLDTTLHGPSVNIYSRDGLTVDTQGNVLFSAGADLVVSTDDALTFQVQGLIDIEAEKGSFYNSAGGNLVISSSDYIRLDGPRGVSLDTSGTLSLVGAVEVDITGITTDVVSKGNIAISFPNVNVYGRDGVAIGGKAVNLTSRGDLSVTGLGPSAEILFDVGANLQLEAPLGSVNLETSGEATDISWWTATSLVNIGDDLNINTPTNVRIGSNLTDTFYVGTNIINWNSDNTYVTASGHLGTTSTGQTKYSARDIFSESYTYYEEATTGAITVIENSLSILSREGDPSHFVTIQSAGGITSSSSNKFTFGAYTIDGLFTNSQTYNVKDSSFTSTTDRDIIFGATQTETFTVEDDIDIVTKVAVFQGTDGENIRVDDFTINSDDFVSLASFYHLSTLLDITFTAGHQVNYAGTTLNDVSGGVIRVDADDNVILGAGDLSFTSALLNKIDMQDHVLYTVADDASLSTKATFRYDLSDSWYLKTSNFVLQGTQGITFTIAEWDGVFGSLAITSTDDALFDTKGLGFIEIYSGHNLDFLANLGLTLKTGDSINSLTQEITSFDAALSTLSFTTQGDFHIQGSGDMIWHANGNIFFGEATAPTSDSTVTSDIFRAGAGGQLSIVALDTVNFLQTDSYVHAQTDVQFFAVQGSLNIADQAEPADITLFGHVINEVTLQESTWTAGQRFGFSAVDFLMHSNSDLDITTSTSTIEGFTASFVGSSTSSVQGDTLYVVTGYDQYLHGVAGGTIDFTSRETQITSSSDIGFVSSGGAVSVTSKQDLTFQSILGQTLISANGAITAKAVAVDGNFGMNSAEDLAYYTNSGNIIHTARNVNFNTGQDFHVISQKADASLTTGCAVEFYTTDLSATFTTEVGELYLSGWEDFHIRSVIGALGSSGDVHVKSNGNSFFESQESALAYFARGVKGFSAQTNDVHYGNMELHAADADVWFFGSQGFVWNSDQDFYLLADDGMNITAAKTDAGVPGLPATISISSTDLSTIDGARGLIFVAGLDAPIVKADFSASSTQYTNLETYDQLHVRAAAGHFRVTSESSENVITKEQSQAKFSSAGDTLWTAGQDTTYTTIDGDQFFDANAFAINVDASRAVRVTTTEGPVVLRAIAGSFLLDAGNWELTSQMDSRFAALGFARLNAQASLRLISSSTNELDCVLLQNYRNLDSIFTNSKTTMTVTATTNGLTPRQEYSIQTIGDNIDFFAGNAIDLSSTGAFWVGNHTSPEIRITAGTGAVNGITSTSSEGTLARSQNTVTVVGNTFLYEVDSAFLESTGLIYLVSQAGANNINAHDSLTLNSEFLTADIVGNHVIDGQGTAAVRWTSEGTGIGDRMELRTTDLVQTSSDTINYVSSILYQLTLKGDYSVTAGGDISFQNIRPDDANYPKPFFSDIQTERGKEIWTVGDTWTLGAATDILVDLGRFGTPFTTNFTTGDFQQTSIDFDISGAFNWAAATYTIKAAYEGSTVQLQSTGFDLSADTSVTLQTVLPAKTGGYVHIDPLDSTINFRTLGFLSIDSTTSANYAAAGTLTEESLDQTTYSYTGDWNVLVTNNDQDSLVEFTSYESSVNFGNTVTSELTFDSTVVPNPFTNHLDTLYRSLYSSDAEVNYDFTDWTVDAGAAGRVQADASTIYLQPSTSLTATATLGKLILNTEEYQSDITVSSSGPMLFNPSALALFSSSDLLELRGTTTSTYTGADTTLTTGWGDISFDLSQDLKVVAAAAANILANGYDADNSRAFTLETNKLTATTTDDLYFLAKQGIEINSPDNTISFIAGILSLQSTNYVSPVVLNSVNSGITFAATTNNWAAGGVSLVESHDISLTAATALTIQAVTTGGPAIRDAGILFDTNPEQNMQSVISLTGDTAAHTAQWLTVSTDFTTADDGGIGIFTTGGAASVFNLQANDELNFLNNHGDMLFNLADAIVGSITTAVNIFSGSQVWNLGTGTMDSTASTVVRTGGSVFFNTPALLLDIADDLTLVTKEFGRSNDIYFRTEANIAFTSTGTTRFSGSGSDTDIVIEANADTVGQTITFFSSNSVSLFTRSGISLTTSEGTNTGFTDINFSTQSTFDVTTSEWKANIFFQSDRDTIFRDLDGEIRHSNYHSRLGFFSVTPATIRLINLQGIEGCVRARFCGARTSGTTSAVWTSAIANVGAVATELHELIRTWGLVDWTTLIDKTSFLY